MQDSNVFELLSERFCIPCNSFRRLHVAVDDYLMLIEDLHILFVSQDHISPSMFSMFKLRFNSPFNMPQFVHMTGAL